MVFCKSTSKTVKYLVFLTLLIDLIDNFTSEGEKPTRENFEFRYNLFNYTNSVRENVEVLMKYFCFIL